MTEKNQARLNEILSRIAHKPSTDDLWALHGVLLACTADQPHAQLANEVAREFYLYLSELQSKMTSQQYNELASWMDIGAVGMVALQDILAERGSFWKNLLLGGMGESLMALASRQYVKAWKQELQSVQQRTAWNLYGMLWQLSCQQQPDMETSKRQTLIDTALTPLLDENQPFETQVLLVLRLFQAVLLLLATPLCSAQ